MRQRAPMPAPGGISFGPGEVLISVVNVSEIDDLALAFGPNDGFTSELRAAAAEAFRREELE